MSEHTITEFLEARIAEDEAVAQAASIGSESWRLGEYDETILWWPPSDPEKVEFVRREFGDELAAEHARWAGQTIESCGEKIAPHISRHDPARALAECAAKRAIVELVRPYLVYQSTSDTSREFLQVLAAVYKDHPDYQQEWVK